MGGIPPLGYDVVARKLVVNAAEAELVRLIFRRFLELGSATRLVEELAAAGHRTKSWTTQDGKQRQGSRIDKGAKWKNQPREMACYQTVGSIPARCVQYTRLATPGTY